MRSGPLSQQEVIILDVRHEITEATPLFPPDQSPLNQLETHPPVFAVALLSSPVLSAQKEAEPRPVLQQEGIILDLRHEITETTPPPPPDPYPLNQLQAHPPVSAPAPIPTSHASPDSTILQNSSPPRCCITAFCHILHQLKRKLFSSP